MRGTRALILVAIVVLVAGCSDAPPPLAIHPLDSGAHASSSIVERLVLADSTAFQRWWSGNARDGNPHGTFDASPALPSVDFARQEVVVATSGRQPSGCWSIGVTNATALPDGSLAIEVTTYAPGAGVTCPAELTTPYAVVAIDSRAPVADFVERTSTFTAS